MRKLIVAFTILIILLSLVASFAGVISTGHNSYRIITTARGEIVEVQDAGIYRYSLRTLVTSGIPWDFVRLFVGIPVLLISFLLYLQDSLRGTALFIGSLASFFYQYVLWTFDWAFNSLFLVYVVLFSLSLWTLILILTSVDGAEVREAVGDRFPVKTTAGFSFALGGILLLKCLAEIVPGLGSGAMPAGMVGYYTLVDQALDIGLLTPFCLSLASSSSDASALGTCSLPVCSSSLSRWGYQSLLARLWSDCLLVA